jgi:predicted DNA-binding protein (MmcQ/YjbR family)
MPKPPRLLSDEAAALLSALRRWTADLPGVELATTFGNPTWQVGGKTFMVLDRYRDTDCLWLRVPPDKRQYHLTSPGWFESPHDPKKHALCLDISQIDGRRMRALIRASFQLALTS